MLRILLVIDDYNELVYLQTLLRKIGFDVDGIQNQRKFEETLLVFNPQLIVATARGKRVDGVALIRDLNRRTSSPKLILLRPIHQNIPDAELDYPQVEAVIDSPVNLRQLLTSIAGVVGMDPEALFEKYNKIKSKAEESPEEDVLQIFKESLGFKDEPPASTTATPARPEEPPPVRLELAPTTLSPEERRKRFEAVTKDVETPKEVAFDPHRVKAYNREVRAQENIDELRDLEKERREFTKSLFSQGRSRKP